MDRVKQAVKVALLIFVAATLAMQVGNSFRNIAQAPLPQGLTVIVCHAKIRCPTCATMERLAKQCLAEYFPDAGVQFATLNYAAAENRGIAEKYGIATATVLLVRREGEVETVENLVTPAWETIGDDAVFIEMLRTHLAAFLHGEELNRHIDEHEIEIPEDWDNENVWE